ncbi:UbiA prenyltransferase [Apiospora aurea]|uniref:UbiA prenyltransferase n=1 Tax=Apiospora aurea TaxID=335848 RepID=A0ABR1Q3I9_9PEZI
MSEFLGRLPDRKADTSEMGQSMPDQIFYHIHTIWLFTVGDLSTTCLQSVLFGLSGAASGRFTTPAITDDTRASRSTPQAAVGLIRSLPPVFLFVWLLLLVGQLSNQSAVGAPEEDALSKPYRPIPAGQISQRQVREGLMPPAIFLALLVSLALSVHWEAATFIALLLNGAALALLGEGALKLAACSGGSTVSAAGYAWSCIVGLVIAMTVQVQDFRDQEGDAARGRKTLPLVLGDAPTRGGTIVSMLLWAVLVPWLCGAGVMGCSSSVVTAGAAAVGLAVWRTPGADARSYKLWSVWLANVYIMPWLALLC